MDEERVSPTIQYDPARQVGGAVMEAISAVVLRPRIQHMAVQDYPEYYQFKSVNFDLLSVLLDQVQEQNRSAWLATILSRISNAKAYRHRFKQVLGAGQWERCASELPLVLEFLVRRGYKQMFIQALAEAAPSPGLTLLLIQLEAMILLNFTLFTDDEYTQLPTAIAGIQATTTALRELPHPANTIESNVRYHIVREIPELCESVLEKCRKARYLYIKGSLLQGMNLEVNQDKDRVRTYLQKLGFTPVLTQSLEEAERLYRSAATPFELKSSMGHLRSFLEQLHIQACSAAHKKLGGAQPSKWGEALQYLRGHSILSLKEEQFAAQFYALMSDTSVHPLVAEREYARLMRNISIEYGLLLLTKLDKLGLK
jgi:hypothetical protein